MAEPGTGWENFPAEGQEGELRQVFFGPPSTAMNILVQYDVYADDLNITVGNGPDHEDAPAEVSAFLRDVASVIETMGETDHYKAEIAKLNDEEAEAEYRHPDGTYDSHYGDATED